MILITRSEATSDGPLPTQLLTSGLSGCAQICFNSIRKATYTCSSMVSARMRTFGIEPTDPAAGF
jgi:hypothetical protein